MAHILNMVTHGGGEAGTSPDASYIYFMINKEESINISGFSISTSETYDCLVMDYVDGTLSFIYCYGSADSSQVLFEWATPITGAYYQFTVEYTNTATGTILTLPSDSDADVILFGIYNPNL